MGASMTAEQIWKLVSEGILDTLYREAKVEKVEYSQTIDVTAVCTHKTIGRLKDYIEGYEMPKEDWE